MHGKYEICVKKVWSEEMNGKDDLGFSDVGGTIILIRCTAID
jgi:hypothetical protein